jgi:hypothetical protein
MKKSALSLLRPVTETTVSSIKMITPLKLVNGAFIRVGGERSACLPFKKGRTEQRYLKNILQLKS